MMMGTSQINARKLTKMNASVLPKWRGVLDCPLILAFISNLPRSISAGQDSFRPRSAPQQEFIYQSGKIRVHIVPTSSQDCDMLGSMAIRSHISNFNLGLTQPTVVFTPADGLVILRERARPFRCRAAGQLLSHRIPFCQNPRLYRYCINRLLSFCHPFPSSSRPFAILLPSFSILLSSFSVLFRLRHACSFHRSPHCFPHQNLSCHQITAK